MEDLLTSQLARALGSLEGVTLLIAVGAVATWLWWRRKK